MSVPRYVRLAVGVDEWFRLAETTPRLRSKFDKARKAVRLMRTVGPSHPGFQTHRMENLLGIDGQPIWNSYVENATANAWRMYWTWQDDGGIVIVSLGPHTHTPGLQPKLSRKGVMADK